MNKCFGETFMQNHIDFSGTTIKKIVLNWPITINGPFRCIKVIKKFIIIFTHQIYYSKESK
jgi:hypothetical protein